MTSIIDLNHALGKTFPIKTYYPSSWRELRANTDLEQIEGVEIFGFGKGNNPSIPTVYEKSRNLYLTLSATQPEKDLADPCNRRYTPDEMGKLVEEWLVIKLKEPIPAFKGAVILNCKKELAEHFSTDFDELAEALTIAGFKIQKFSSKRLAIISDVRSIDILIGTWTKILIEKQIKKLEELFASTPRNPKIVAEIEDLSEAAFTVAHNRDNRAQIYLLDTIAIKHSGDSDSAERIDQIYRLLVSQEFPTWTRDEFDRVIAELKEVFGATN